MKIKLLDLVPQYESIKGEIRKAIDEVLSSQQFILGSRVVRLEEQIAAYCGVRYAVGVASGSDALLLSLMVCGVGSGDEVITTPYTFFSTVSAVTRLGAKPVFADVDPRTYNIDPGGVGGAMTGRTKAIIVVHLFGQMADMDSILEAARKGGVPVIEDACQAVGATYGEGRAGSLGTIGCFSFFPSKNLGCYGDGGMIVTNDKDLADEARSLRHHGSRRRYFHDTIGINSRLDAIQAAVLSVKLAHLDSWNERRRENAAYYSRKLSVIDGVTPPYEGEKRQSVYHQYVVRARDRNGLKSFLEEHGVGCEIYYPVPLHLQQCFSFLGGKEGEFPEAERAAAETLALPIYPELSRAEQDYVIEKIEEFVQVRT